MSDLNLIPQEIKIQEDLRRRRKSSVIILAAVVMVLVALTSVPFYLIHKINLQQKTIEEQINNLSYVDDEIKEINKNNKANEEKLKILKHISGMEKKWTIIIDDLSLNLPWEITIDALDANADIISISGVSKSHRAIAVFASNLEKCGKYENITINDIITDAESGNFNFNMSFSIKSHENGEK